jgi:hypothetical protein
MRGKGIQCSSEEANLVWLPIIVEVVDQVLI